MLNKDEINYGYEPMKDIKDSIISSSTIILNDIIKEIKPKKRKVKTPIVKRDIKTIEDAIEKVRPHSLRRENNKQP